MATTPNITTVEITAQVLKIGDGYLAFAVIGGVRCSGGRRTSAYEALGSLFSVLAGNSGDNSAVAIALEMLLAGVDINSLPELGAGS